MTEGPFRERRRLDDKNDDGVGLDDKVKVLLERVLGRLRPQ
jgi:hypothetical protein